MSTNLQRTRNELVQSPWRTPSFSPRLVHGLPFVGHIYRAVFLQQLLGLQLFAAVCSCWTLKSKVSKDRMQMTRMCYTATHVTLHNMIHNMSDKKLLNCYRRSSEHRVWGSHMLSKAALIIRESRQGQGGRHGTRVWNQLVASTDLMRTYRLGVDVTYDLCKQVVALKRGSKQIPRLDL